MAGIPGIDMPTDQELLELVFKDDLTGLYNRRFFARYMKQEADWSPGSPPVALCMMDMDNLKRINDRLGHMTGDASLERIGQIFLAQAEATGRVTYAIRYAGDEFAWILPNTNREEALGWANALREAVVDDAYEGANLPDGLRPSLSVGVAVYPDDAPTGGDELTEAADKALYYSKRTGKNKVTSVADLAGGADEVSDMEAMAGFPARTLVGREDVFKRVDEAIALTLDGHYAFMVLEGEAGSGKTRMLAEIAKYAKERELAVLIEKCSAVSREEPYKAIGGLLDQYLAKLSPDQREKALERVRPEQRSALREILPRLPQHPAGRSGSGPRPRRGPPAPSPNGPPPPVVLPPVSGGRRPAPPSSGSHRAVRPAPGGPAARRPGPVRRRPGPPPRGARRRPGAPPPPQARRRPGPAPRRPAQPVSSGQLQRPGSSSAVKRDAAELTVALFTGLVELLTGLSRIRPVVVLLDDFEHADEATLELIRRTLPRSGRLLFVGAARSTAQDGPETPYTAFRESLADHANHFRVHLDLLDRAQSMTLASHLLDGYRPLDDLADKIQAYSRGNPLFIEGMLRHLIDTGVMVKAGESWTFEQPIPDEFPMGLEELLRAQLKIITPETAELLAQAAVIGPNFDFNVVRASCGTVRPESETVTLVDEAVRACLIEEDDDELIFTSSAVQETAYKTLEPTERREAHRRVAETVEKNDGQSAVLAYHFARAGDPAKRDRFLQVVKARKDALFDIEAIEGISDGRPPLVPELTEAPPDGLLELLPDLCKAIAAAAKVLQTFPPTSRTAEDAGETLARVLGQMHDLAPAFTLSHRGNAVVVNFQSVDKEHGRGDLQAEVAGILRANSLKSVTFVKPPSIRELLAFLGEAAQHEVTVPVARSFWSVFSRDQNLKHIGLVQKTLALRNKAATQRIRRTTLRTGGGVAEKQLPQVKELINHLVQSLRVGRQQPGAQAFQDAIAALDRCLRQLLEAAPAIAIHEGVDTIVVNGTPIPIHALSPGGPELLQVLREGQLRGLVLLEAVTPQELERFVARIAKLEPKDFEGGRDPLAEINMDGSLPNLLVGEALFQLAKDLIKKANEKPEGEAQVSRRDTAELEREEDVFRPSFREPALPADFQWPSDELAQKAQALCEKPAADLLVAAGAEELADLLDTLLLDRPLLARRLIEHFVVNFAHQQAAQRAQAADLLLKLARKGSGELRSAFYAMTVRRLADALQLEADLDTFEKLAEVAKAAILDCVREGAWDMGARLVRGVSARREGRAEVATQIYKAGQRVLQEVLADPRFDRVFETIETGSLQERRKAARILDGMRGVAVERLVRALMETGRDRVEAFLIETLAALVPESETALTKEVTPFAQPAASRRLIRAAKVVCADPSPVLISGLQNPDMTVQTEAVQAARDVGGRVAQRVLRWAIQNGTPRAQLEAVKHLGELARPEALDALLGLLQGTNLMEVQRECCLALGKLALKSSHHDKIVPVLVTFLRPGGLLRTEYHEDVRAAAAWGLGQMKNHQEARRALERALDDKDRRVRLTADMTLKGKQ